MLFGWLVDVQFAVCVCERARWLELGWVGSVTAVVSKGKLNKAFKNTHQEGGLTERPRSRWWNCLQMDIGECIVESYKRQSGVTGGGCVREGKVRIGL